MMSKRSFILLSALWISVCFLAGVFFAYPRSKSIRSSSHLSDVCVQNDLESPKSPLSPSSDHPEAGSNSPFSPDSSAPEAPDHADTSEGIETQWQESEEEQDPSEEERFTDEAIAREQQDRLDKILTKGELGDCSVCMCEMDSEEFCDVFITACGHAFHSECIDQCMKNCHSKSCPLCRAKITRSEARKMAAAA
jgi:hypothetical protein